MKRLYVFFDKRKTMKPIRTKKDYDQALNRLNELFDAKAGTPESKEADKLAVLINEYEERVYPINK